MTRFRICFYESAVLQGHLIAAGKKCREIKKWPAILFDLDGFVTCRILMSDPTRKTNEQRSEGLAKGGRQYGGASIKASPPLPPVTFNHSTIVSRGSIVATIMPRGASLSKQRMIFFPFRKIASLTHAQNFFFLVYN